MVPFYWCLIQTFRACLYNDILSVIGGWVTWPQTVTQWERYETITASVCSSWISFPDLSSTFELIFFGLIEKHIETVLVLSLLLPKAAPLLLLTYSVTPYPLSSDSSRGTFSNQLSVISLQTSWLIAICHSMNLSQSAPQDGSFTWAGNKLSLTFTHSCFTAPAVCDTYWCVHVQRQPPFSISGWWAVRHQPLRQLITTHGESVPMGDIEKVPRISDAQMWLNSLMAADVQQ